jgi:hypothetical protein
MARFRSFAACTLAVGSIIIACGGDSSVSGTASDGGGDGADDSSMMTGNSDSGGMPVADSGKVSTDSGMGGGKTDGAVKDGAATDGSTSCAPKCTVGQACAGDGDCTSGACDMNGTCATDAAHDHKVDDGESDVDCGGATTDGASKCALGKICVNDADCLNNNCGAGKTCSTPGAVDGIQDDGESDIDCGGNTTDGAPKCGVGKMCVLDNDCTSGACGADLHCAVSGAVDGKKDNGESDIDCGGNTTDMAPTCDLTKMCAANNDCTSGYCSAGLVCVANGYTDGKKDFGESDIDCGGHSTDGASPCADTYACVDSLDCMNGFCNPGTMKCATPTSSDGYKNGSETDVDCGGGPPTNAPACVPGKVCKTDADCQKYRSYLSPSGVCNDAGICAYGPSCRHADGGYSCGPTKDQDCCKSPPVTVAGVSRGIDAYKITAGRMREFTKVLNGDVTTWYMNNRASLPAAVKAQLDPYLDVVTGQTHDVILPSDLHSFPWGVDYQLGGTIYTGNYPSTSQGCYVGPHGSGAEGSHTYDNGGAEGDVRGYTTGMLDRLPINCVTYVMLAAFCAWDGGRLSTRAEHQAIGYNGTPTGAPATTWIWGNTPTAGGWDRNTDQIIVGPATSGFNNTACPTCEVQYSNWQQVYLHIRFDPAVGSGGGYTFPPMEPGIPLRDVPVNFNYLDSDLSGAQISPPGRFPYDAYPGGTDLTVKTHYDVMGVMMELNEASSASLTQFTGVQADPSSFCNSNADCITNNCCLAGACMNKCQGTNSEPGNYWTGGSWEGHQLKGSYNEPMMTKYGKATGRCARD